MEELIKLLEKEQDVFESKYALEEHGFEQGLQKAIDIVKLFAIPDVSNLLNADNAPTFDEWLAKYFEPAKVSRTYKDKIKGSEYTEHFLYKKYARAYKLSI